MIGGLGALPNPPFWTAMQQAVLTTLAKLHSIPDLKKRGPAS